jgi:rubrerythrin
MTYAFNVTFTRSDENNATVYSIGYNIEATTQAEAEKKVRARHDHLTVTAVALYAILTDEGDVVYAGPSTALTATVWACKRCGICAKEEQCTACGTSLGQMSVSAALQLFMERYEPPTGWYNEADLRREWEAAK